VEREAVRVEDLDLARERLQTVEELLLLREELLLRAGIDDRFAVHELRGREERRRREADRRDELRVRLPAVRHDRVGRAVAVVALRRARRSEEEKRKELGGLEHGAPV